MKRVLPIYLGLMLSSALFALDISLEGTAGDFGIQEQLDRRTRAGDSASMFDMHHFDMTMKDEITSNLFVVGSVTRDDILQNGISAAASIQFNNVNISVGPYFTVGSSENDDLTSGDFFNTDNLFLPGVVLGTEIGRQGHITGFFSMKTSLSQSVTDLSFKMYSLGLRFWVPNVICEARFDQKKSQKPVSGVTSAQTDAGVYFDIFQKTLPFRFMLKGLWRNVSKSYAAGINVGNTYTGTFTPDPAHAGSYIGTMTQAGGSMLGAPGEDSVNYVIVGADVTVIMNSSLQWHAGAECSVFTWYPDDNQFLNGTPNDKTPDFSVTIGVRYTFKEKEAPRVHMSGNRNAPPAKEDNSEAAALPVDQTPEQ